MPNKVIFTKKSEKQLIAIFDFHVQYSTFFAVSFHEEITIFILENLTIFPKL